MPNLLHLERLKNKNKNSYIAWWTAKAVHQGSCLLFLDSRDVATQGLRPGDLITVLQPVPIRSGIRKTRVDRCKNITNDFGGEHERHFVSAFDNLLRILVGRQLQRPMDCFDDVDLVRFDLRFGSPTDETSPRLRSPDHHESSVRPRSHVDHLLGRCTHDVGHKRFRISELLVVLEDAGSPELFRRIRRSVFRRVTLERVVFEGFTSLTKSLDCEVDQVVVVRIFHDLSPYVGCWFRPFWSS